MSNPSPPNSSLSDSLRGSLAMVLSALLFGSMGFAARLISPEIPALESVCVRGATNALALFCFMKWRRISVWGTHRRELAWRGAAGTVAAFCYFLSVSLGPSAEAISIYRGSALFMPFLAYIILGERLTTARISCAALGFIGTLLILKPGFSQIQLGLWIALAGAFINAVGWVAIRSLSNKESPATIIFYFALFSALGAFAVGGPSFKVPNETQSLALAAIAVAGLVGQYFLTVSYRYADAAVVTPLGYTEIVALLMLSWAFFDEVPDPLSWVGIGLVILAGVLVSRPERSRSPA